MKNISPYQLMQVAKQKGYAYFSAKGRNYNLNIWGIRNSDIQANTFNDSIIVWWEVPDTDLWDVVRFAATTDPGLYYRNNPINKLGTAILKAGQYRNCYQIGKHRGSDALIQTAPITVYRDANDDNIIDIDSPNVNEQTGMFGINIHSANENGQSVLVDKWSAGCQVIQNTMQEYFINEKLYSMSEFDYFMLLMNLATANYGRKLTYTLINEYDIYL